jgi:hypothetical protein
MTLFAHRTFLSRQVMTLLAHRTLFTGQILALFAHRTLFARQILALFAHREFLVRHLAPFVARRGGLGHPGLNLAHCGRRTLLRLQRSIVRHALASGLGARPAPGTPAATAAAAAPATAGLALDPRLGESGSHRLNRLGRIDLTRTNFARRPRLVTPRAFFSRAFFAWAVVAGTIVARRPFPAWRSCFARSTIFSRRDRVAAPFAPWLAGGGLRTALASDTLLAYAARGTRALFPSGASPGLRALLAASATRAAAFAALLGLANRPTRARRDAHSIRPRAKSEESVRAFVDHRDHCLGAGDAERFETLADGFVQGLAFVH